MTPSDADTFMKWQGTFELNIKEFDDHHKQLVFLMNAVHRDVVGGANQGTVLVVLGELIKYASYHFSAEEYWMEKHGYPNVTRHKQEHSEFSSRVATLKCSLSQSKTDLSMEVLTFLMDWFTCHILESDALYGTFARTLPHDTAL